MNNKAYTLIELILYMVLGLVVASFSLRAMSDMSVSYVSARSITKLQINGRDAINVLSRDIANTGFKYYINKDTLLSSGNETVIYTVQPTPLSDDAVFLFGSYLSSYVDNSSPSDFMASFYEMEGDISDTIEFFRSKLVTTDSVGWVERTSYFISNDTLMRATQVCTNRTLVSGAIDWQSPDTMQIIAGAKGLQFQFSTNGYSWVDSPTLTNSRDQMKYVKIDLLVVSDRASDMDFGTGSMAIGNQNIARESGYRYRTYSKVVPIRNNGILK
jgi:Tfp pilus assembly protein PilW